ncbi:MAG: DUF2752 domain-containing protein [Bacteroidales bacterium]
MEISIIPNFLIKRISNNDINQINWNILISTILILFSLLFVRLNLINSIPHFCLFQKLTQFPCPACGISRSILHLYDLKIIDSLKFNPNGLLISTTFILQIPMRIIALINRDYFSVIEKISRIITRLTISTLLTHWFYLIINFNF